MGRLLARHWFVSVLIAALSGVLIVHLVAERTERLSHRESYPRSNYSCIEEGLYLGGILEEPPPGTRAVLNVCETRDPYEAEIHQWKPIPDAVPAPSLDWLREQVEFIDRQRRGGLPVFVHCRAGVSRSCMVVAAYLMRRDACTRDEALALIRTKRSLVGPNPAFMELLLQWESEVRATKSDSTRSVEPSAAPRVHR
jgi:hypothetical protein